MSVSTQECTAEYVATSSAARPAAAPNGRQRLLSARAGSSLSQHVQAFGPLPSHTAEVLLDAVGRAGLTGRGGAAFPMHRKLAAVAAQGHAAHGSAVVLANGAEGEPASGKDRCLLRVAPHLVLDGIQIAARIVGARTAYLYVPDEDAVQRSLRAALDQRSDDVVRVELAKAPDRFVAGQETAAVASVDGGAALPRFARRPVYERGVGGQPTLVQNVETLAQLALLARHGPAWFRTMGTPTEPGTMLVTVSGGVRQPQVVEVALGTLVGDVLELAGGVSEPLGALLVGGYHGGWLTGADLRGRTLSGADLGRDGLAVGAGVLAALPASRCGLVESARVVAYLAGESARQCGPCSNGLPAIAAALGEAARPGGSPQAPALLERWTAMMPGRGACAHPDGTTRFVASTLRAFEPELVAHSRGVCTATDRTPVLPTPTTADRGWR